MAITINNSIANIDGTPGAASGVFSNRPSAANVANGTLYFATDTAVIYQAVAGSWVNYAGGGGGGSSTGVNGLNGTTNIALGGTLNDDTNIDADNFSFDFQNLKSSLFKTTLGNSIFLQDGIAGIRTEIDFEQKGVLVFGDRVLLGDYIDGSLNFNVEVDTGTIFTNYSSQGTNGFILDFVLNQYKLGDYQNQVGGSALLIDATNGNIITFYNDTQIGIKLDFANNAYTFGSVLAAGSNFVIDNFNGNVYITNSINQFTGFNFDMIGQIYQFGDLPGGNKITFDNNGEIKIDASNLFRSYYSNQINGISIDFVNSFYIFGAVENGQGTQLYLNDTNNVSYFLNTANGSSGAQGLYLEFAPGRYIFGDVSNVVTGQTLEINSSDEATFFTYAGNTNGISLQFADEQFYFGDLASSLAYININASVNKIFFVSTDGLYNIANIPAYTDNADALANGLVVGDLYRHDGALESADQLRIVH